MSLHVMNISVHEYHVKVFNLVVTCHVAFIFEVFLNSTGVLIRKNSHYDSVDGQLAQLT